jgi:hypothetical protein
MKRNVLGCRVAVHATVGLAVYQSRVCLAVCPLGIRRRLADSDVRLDDVFRT